MTRPPAPKTFFVGLCGNIGVGKSLFAERLGQRTGWQVYYEPVSQNPYLEDFYADMRRWAFHLQIYFLAERFKAQKHMNLHGAPFIQDRTIYEDGEVFARVLHERGEMDRQDFESYLALFGEMVELLAPPGLLIYLKASPQALLPRIARRGRSCERSIAVDYLAQLDRAYQEWVVQAAKTSPVLTIDTEKMVYPPGEALLDTIVDRIQVEARRCGARVPRTVGAGGSGGEEKT